MVVRRIAGRVAVSVQPLVDFKESWSILFEKLRVGQPHVFTWTNDLPIGACFTKAVDSDGIFKMSVGNALRWHLAEACPFATRASWLHLQARFGYVGCRDLPCACTADATAASSGEPHTCRAGIPTLCTPKGTETSPWRERVLFLSGFEILRHARHVRQLYERARQNASASS